MTVLLTLTLAWWPLLAGPQAPPADVKSLFEAGKHQEVVAAVTGNQTAAPQDVYLAGQAAERLNSLGQAREFYSRLASRPESDPWGRVGRSALALLDGKVDAALTQATQAASTGSSIPQTHFQVGLVQGHKKAYPAAATAFQRAAQADPNFAYAHYYAGLSYYRAKRVDLMTKYFEAFLKLAPNAPERPEVESILRTVRGR